MKKYQYKYTHGVGYEETQKRHMTKKNKTYKKKVCIEKRTVRRLQKKKVKSCDNLKILNVILS